jgi:hypothetical protein
MCRFGSMSASDLATVLVTLIRHTLPDPERICERGDGGRLTGIAPDESGRDSMSA